MSHQFEELIIFTHSPRAMAAVLVLCTLVATVFPLPAIAELDGFSDPKDLRAYVAKLDKFIEAHPDDADAYGDKAQTLSWLHDYDAALTAMNKAISLKPEQAMFYYVRGLKIYSPMNREREALKDYDMAIRLGLNKPRVYTERAHSKYVLGDYKGASSDVALALSRDPKDIDALAIRGRLELKSGKYSAAIEALTKAIDIGPSSRVITPDIKRAMADMHSVRAECYQKVRETEKAEADFSKAKELLLEAKKSEERTGEPGK